MDPQTLAWIIVIVTILVLTVAIVLFSVIAGFLVGDVAITYRRKKMTERFNPLLVKLLEQNSPTKDIIDLYKSVFNVTDKNTTDFVSKIIESLEDFKTWKLEIESNTTSNQQSLQSREFRNKINQTMEEINLNYPFADLKPENKIFFEDFKKFIENREFEACKSKLIDLSKIFSNQNKELEDMAKQTRYAYYLSIIGAVIGVCGIILTLI
jgi:hypothetical protein